MKICIQCGQVVAEAVITCPACGAEVAAGRTAIDDYRIIEVVREGYASILCKARREDEPEPVAIRIFTPPAGVDNRLANRLKRELDELQELPESYFVRHLAIRQSEEGLWYRISEWVETLSWGSLLASGRLHENQTGLDLLARIARILEGLHRIGHIIPHLILDDILVYEDASEGLKVKIDYKLSRFLDPRMDRPGPMLARLLALHPDIVHQRPLDYRSDIWSLGKVFVEILAADPDTADLAARAENLPVPQEICTLVRLMLSETPDLRPSSMAEVATVLGRATEREVAEEARGAGEAPDAAVRTLRRLNLRLGLLIFLLTLLIAVGGLLWYYLGFRNRETEVVLQGYANRYAASVAFVVVDYGLELEGREVYHSRSEGTAFLADAQGYLLTNRHVACPWLADARLLRAITVLRRQPGKLDLVYRMFLWFEGQRAFNRLPALSEEASVEDIYRTEAAFSTRGARRVRIAGVAPIPAETAERLRSPLGDDFAVLKIDAVPPGLVSLPLAADFESAAIPKLAPLITLGFPLGSSTQAATVNVSVTSGHVRRTFGKMIQVDTSIHSGNSGGPFIDARGRVVGIATSVAKGRVLGPTPAATPLSDIGLVLPINEAAAFVAELKAGATKWNGELDLALEARLGRIMSLARSREWGRARILAAEELAAAPTPPLIMAAAMMHLCAGDHDGGRRLFEKFLSIDPNSNLTRLLLLVIDRFEGQLAVSAQRQPLTALDWRSKDEFIGHLARILTGEVDTQGVLAGGYTASEKSWLHLMAGLVAESRGQGAAARTLLETAVLKADPDNWGLYLALARLDGLQQAREAQLTDPVLNRAYRQQVAAFYRRMDDAIAAWNEHKRRLAAPLAALRHSAAGPEASLQILETIRAQDAHNHDLLIALAYHSAMVGRWEAALGYIREFLALPGRLSPGKLSLGLLEPEILKMQGQTTRAREALAAYHDRIPDPWYRSLAASLIEPHRQGDIVDRAEEHPAYLLTGNTVLGLWAEGHDNIPGAIRHYREALGSYMDYRIEYDFALARVKHLRQASE